MDYDILTRRLKKSKHIIPAFVNGYEKAISDVSSIEQKRLNKQDLTVSKILFEMIEKCLINTKDAIQVQNYLLQSYGVGFNEGNKYHSNPKEVIRMDRDGRNAKPYESIIKAANANKIDASSISKAITGNRRTAGGYLWKLKD